MPSKLSQFGDLLAPSKSRKRAPGFTTTRKPGSSHKQSVPTLLAPPIRPVPDPPPPTASIPATPAPAPNDCAMQEPPLRLPQQVTPSATELEAIAQVLSIYDRQLAPGPIAQELLASSPAKAVQRHVRDRLQRIDQVRKHLNQAATILLGLCQL